MSDDQTLYQRLGGYDAIVAVLEGFLERMVACPQMGRFWLNRGADGVEREKQLLFDYICAAAGGPVRYDGRDMKTTHAGMGLSESDWEVTAGHLVATLEQFEVPEREKGDILDFISSQKADIVELP